MKRLRKISIRRQVRNIVCLFAVLTAGCLHFLAAAESETSDDVLNKAGQVIRDIPYLPGSPRTTGDFYIPSNVSAVSPVAMTIHGGEWAYMDKDSFQGVAQFLCEEGYLVFNINYRLLGEGPWPLCGDDCLATVEFLLKAENPYLKNVKREHIAVLGGSSGGHLALMTGLRACNRVNKVVSISGIADVAMDYAQFPDRYKDFFESAPSENDLLAASPTGHLNENRPAILCTHAEGDKVVNPEEAKSFITKYTQAGGSAEIYLYPRFNDGHCIWRPDSVPRRLYPDIEDKIKSFLKE
ncbi:MAG: alpha/beta hydrolase [Planctomycetia bacterium]|nr:alpha/beta hydrolase [Planctomycetia bacterium]